MEATIMRLLRAIKSTTKNLDDLKIFVIGEHHIFRFVNGNYSWGGSVAEYGYARIDRLDRGKILSIFSKLEFLVNECIYMYFWKKEIDNHSELHVILNKLQFRQRIDVMISLGLLNSGKGNRLKKLASVRNIMAHEWDEKAAMYDGALLVKDDILEKFSDHMQTMMKSLVNIYRDLQESKDYDAYLIDLINDLEGCAK